MGIATIITYCTNDFRFIGKCIEEVKVFSKQIIIPVCDHFFDGSLENRSLLDHTYAQHPDCLFVEFRYFPDRLYSQYHFIEPNDPDWAIYWASTTRYVGFQYVNPDIDYVLFLDSDEIADGKKFLEWFESGKDRFYDAMRLGSYYYVLSPYLCSDTIVSVPLFALKKNFAPLTLFNGLERIGAYMSHPGPKREYVLGADQEPFFHHYSWVRTKDECLCKGKTWSHRNDQDWPALIEEAFGGKAKSLFNSLHKFEKIEKTYFDPFQVSFPKDYLHSSHENVIKIDDRALRKKEIENALI